MGATPDEERQRLIDAAWTVLGKTGFDGFKVASVLRTAGLSTNAFYRHFDGKDELLLELRRDETTRAAQRLEQAVAQAESPVEQVMVWIETLTAAGRKDELRSRARLFSGLGSVVAGFPREIAATRLPLMAPLVRALRNGHEQGLLHAPEPERSAAAIYALCSTYSRELIEGTDNNHLDLEFVTAFALRALAALERTEDRTARRSRGVKVAVATRLQPQPDDTEELR